MPELEDVELPGEYVKRNYETAFKLDKLCCSVRHYGGHYKISAANFFFLVTFLVVVATQMKLGKSF